MQKECANNPFCSLLTTDQREELCKYCIHATWRKGQDFSTDTYQKYATLVLGGLLACTTSVQLGECRTTSVYVAGDFLSYFSFATENIYPFYPGTITCVKDASVIQFPLELIRDIFMENPAIAKYMLQATNCQLLRTQSYLHFVLQQDAYSALMFLLDFCKKNHVPRLTYDELARISNLHRVTVTRTMKEILKNRDFKA